MIGLYCRVSTDKQNIEQQKELLVKYCNEKKLVYRSYIDKGVSGDISKRPSWRKLLADCESEKIDTILITKADRITRSLEYAIWFYKWWKQRNIKFISLYDSIDLEHPDGYFSFMLNCLLSERELLINRWRMRIGIERAKKEGKFKGGKKGRKSWKWKKNKKD